MRSASAFADDVLDGVEAPVANGPAGPWDVEVTAQPTATVNVRSTASLEMDTGISYTSLVPWSLVMGPSVRVPGPWSLVWSESPSPKSPFARAILRLGEAGLAMASLTYFLGVCSLRRNCTSPPIVPAPNRSIMLLSSRLPLDTTTGCTQAMRPLLSSIRART